MNYISTNWLDLSVNSNILKQTYIDGFLDISNNIVGRENLWLRNGSNTMFGLGTNDPSNNLHILTNSPDIHFKRDNQNALIGKLNFVSPIRNNVASASIRCETNQTSGSLIFATGGDSNNPVDSVIVHSNGNVGIGTNNPYQKLHVNGNIYLGSSNSNEYIYSNQKLAFTSNDVINLVADLNDTSGYASTDIICQINNSTILTVDNSSKRVGINTSSPGTKLEVNGTLRTNSQASVSRAGTNHGTTAVGYQKLVTVKNSGWTCHAVTGENGQHQGGYSTKDWVKHSTLRVDLDPGIWVLEANVNLRSNTGAHYRMYSFGVSMGTDATASNIIKEQVCNYNGDNMLDTTLGWESGIQRTHATCTRVVTANETIYAGHYILGNNSTNLRLAGFIRATKVLDLYT